MNRFPSYCRIIARVVAVVLLAGGMLTGAILPVAAHAVLIQTEPPANSTQTTAPTTITFYFDAPPQPGYSKVTVFDTLQRPVVEIKDPVPGDDAKVLIAALPKLKTDSYAVVWQVLSQDGHVAKGAFTFKVALPGDAPPPEAVVPLGDASNSPPFLDVVLRGVRYAGLAALVGGVGVLLLCFIPALDMLPDESRARIRILLDKRAQRWLFGAFGAALAAHLAVLLVQVARVNDLPLFDTVRYQLISGLLKETTFGAVWRVQGIALLVLGEWLVLLPSMGRLRLPGARFGVVANPPRLAETAAAQNDTPIPRWGWAGAFAGGLLLLGATVLGGHTIDITVHPALAMFADWAHLSAMSLWFGGILLLGGVAPALWAGVAARESRVTLAAIIGRFSTLALWSIVVVVATGIFATTQHVTPESLTGTTYGYVLLGKIVLVAVIIAVAALNRFALQPRIQRDPTSDDAARATVRLLRLVSGEILLGIAVIGATGLLTQLSHVMPRQAVAQSVAAASAPKPLLSDVVPAIPTFEVDGVRGTLAVDSHGADVVFDVALADTAGAPRTDVQRVTLWLTSGDRDVGRIIVPLERAPTGHYFAAGQYFVIGQHWLAQIVVRRVNVAEDAQLPFALQPRPILPSDQAKTSASAFPWPHFQRQGVAGGVLAAAGLCVLLLGRGGMTRQGRWLRYSGVALLVVGIVVIGWFSTIAAAVS